MRRGGKTYYFLKNMEGDVTGLLEKDSGDVVARYTYDDWGNCVSVENLSGYTVGNFNPFRYRSYYLDQESGLYYAGSRYYDPEIGRWISADETSYLGINGTVTSYNLYVYCLNNPGNCRDLLGQSTRFIGIEFNCFLGTGVCFCFGRATDDKGNSEWQYSFSVPDPNVGTSSTGLHYLGLGLFSQCTNRDTIYDLYGLSTCRGGSYIIGYVVLFVSPIEHLSSNLRSEARKQCYIKTLEAVGAEILIK